MVRFLVHPGDVCDRNRWTDSIHLARTQSGTPSGRIAGVEGSILHISHDARWHSGDGPHGQPVPAAALPAAVTRLHRDDIRRSVDAAQPGHGRRHADWRTVL